MSKINLTPNAGGTGTLTVTSPNTNSDYTLTLPAVTGTFNTSGGVNEVPAGSASAPSITFTGDTNTGIYSPGADTIAFTEGGVESGRFTSTGALQLNNNLTFSGTGNRITGDFSNATASNRVAFQSSTTNGNTVIEILPNGTSTTSAVLLESDSANTTGSNLQLNMVGGTDARIASGVRGAGTYLPMTFYTNGSERMRIDTSGNVGIGTTSPNQLLDVRGNSSPTIKIRNTGAVINNITQLLFEGTNTFNGTSTSFIQSISLNAGNSSTALVFGTNADGGGAAAERMRITSGGDLQFNSGYGSVATAYGCRAWVNFNGTGTVAIRASGNVTSITDNGTGDYTVNFTTAMPDANYCVSLSSSAESQAANNWNMAYATDFQSARSTSAISMRISKAQNTNPTDVQYVNLAVFR